MTTAFVLSGGASLGSVQVGMLRALYERGLAPDLITGTSVGAVNAAFIGGRPQTVPTADALADVWLGIGTTTIFPVDPVAGLLGLLGLRDGFISNRGLRDLVAGGISFERLEEAAVPTAMIATDARTGHDRRLTSGDGLRATLASAAIPAVLPTIEWDDGARLMDGGVANNTPLSHAIELGADEIYVLPSGFSCDLDRAPRGALASGVHALTMLIGSRLAADIEGSDPAVTVHLIPPPCPIDVQPVDFRRTRELMSRAADIAREFLDGERPERPAVELLRPHRHGVAVST